MQENKNSAIEKTEKLAENANTSHISEDTAKVKKSTAKSGKRLKIKKPCLPPSKNAKKNALN